MKTAARIENVLEQLNKGLPPKVREPDSPEHSMQPMPDVTPAKSKIQHRTAKRIVHEPAEFILRVQSCRRAQEGIVPPKNNERPYNQEIRPTFVTLLRLNVRKAWTRSNEREFQHTTRNSRGG
jgi:hypothetical protein